MAESERKAKHIKRTRVIDAAISCVSLVGSRSRIFPKDVGARWRATLGGDVAMSEPVITRVRVTAKEFNDAKKYGPQSLTSFFYEP